MRADVLIVGCGVAGLYCALNLPKDKKIGFPKNIGCGLGGGNWKVISALIEEILGENFEVYIYELDGE